MTRKTIRAAVETALTGLTTTAGRIYPYRVHHLGENQLPGLRIYLGEEAISEGFDAMSDRARELDLIVEAVAAANVNLDDTLDTIQEEVEAALEGSKLSGNAIDTEYRATDAPELSSEGEVAVGVQRIHFQVTYE